MTASSTFSPPGVPSGAGFGRASRRRFLAGASGLALGGAGLLGGCAAPQPERDAIDPATLVYPPPPEQARFRYDRTIWGSNSVVKETSEDRWRRLATGESDRGKGFAKPFGVVAHEGRVYVSDTVTRHVHVFDHPRARYYEIGTRGVGRLAKPLGMAVDGRGHVYVVDGTAKRVVIFDLEGNYVTAVGGSDDLDRPTGVAVTPGGERIHVLDTGGVGGPNHRVVIYAPDGAILDIIGGRGAGPGEFNLPLDCALDRDGNLYVLDTGNFRCQVFASDGSFLRAFGEAGRYPGQFGHPKGIALDDDGLIYIADTSFGVIQIFDNQGRILMSMGQRSEAQAPGRFLLPAGVSVDVDHRVYAVDQFFRKVDVFRPVAVPEDTPVGTPVTIDLMA